MARHSPFVFLAILFAVVLSTSFVEAQEAVEYKNLKRDSKENDHEDAQVKGELQTITYGDISTGTGVLDTFGLLLSTLNVTQKFPGIKINAEDNNRKNERITEDECDLYGKILAMKLRKYPESMRARVIYKIDGLLLNNPYPESPTTQPPKACPNSSDPN